MSHTVLIIPASGQEVRVLYDDGVDFRTLGAALGGDPQVRRASHVEPTDDGRWTADLRPSGGPVIGPFEKRSEALDEERRWLEANEMGVAE